MAKVEIRTTDGRWIRRNHATAGRPGCWVIDVPELEDLTFCKQPMVRFVLAKPIPKDWGNRHAMLPVSYVVSR